MAMMPFPLPQLSPARAFFCVIPFDSRRPFGDEVRHARVLAHAPTRPARAAADVVDEGEEWHPRAVIAADEDLLVVGEVVRELEERPQLLVASTALHHNAELMSFDADFEQIADVCALRVNRLRRPVVLAISAPLQTRDLPPVTPKAAASSP